MFNKLIDSLSERVMCGVILFAILIGNPLRVIVGDMQKPALQPEATITVPLSSGVMVTRTRSQWKAELAKPEYNDYWERRMKAEDYRNDPTSAKLLYENIPASEAQKAIDEYNLAHPNQTQAEKDYNDSQEDCNGDIGCIQARD